VLDSFAIVGADADIVLVEGAGSPAEVNLRAGDIANMGFAEAADVPVVLVGDIDRGGVIAGLVGTFAVLAPEDRTRVRGFIVNKMRGDAGLFADGVRRIEADTGWPCLGVVPWFADAHRLPAEDVLGLGSGRNRVPAFAGMSGKEERAARHDTIAVPCCRASPISTTSIRCGPSRG
jgi:adenosylcobyric acid synthase